MKHYTSSKPEWLRDITLGRDMIEVTLGGSEFTRADHYRRFMPADWRCTIELSNGETYILDNEVDVMAAIRDETDPDEVARILVSLGACRDGGTNETH